MHIVWSRAEEQAAGADQSLNPTQTHVSLGHERRKDAEPVLGHCAGQASRADGSGVRPTTPRHAALSRARYVHERRG